METLVWAWKGFQKYQRLRNYHNICILHCFLISDSIKAFVHLFIHYCVTQWCKSIPCFISRVMIKFAYTIHSSVHWMSYWRMKVLFVRLEQTREHCPSHSFTNSVFLKLFHFRNQCVCPFICVYMYVCMWTCMDNI